jgi:hypothetical protein
VNEHYITEANYYLDPRTRAKDNRWWTSLDERRGVATLEVWIEDDADAAEWFAAGFPVQGDTIEVEIEWAVCPTCDGKGSYTNPSIDCNGLSAEDFYDDPDFAEGYSSGMYDVTCGECRGKRVVPVPAHPHIRKYLGDMAEERAAHAREVAAEIRMGC